MCVKKPAFVPWWKIHLSGHREDIIKCFVKLQEEDRLKYCQGYWQKLETENRENRKFSCYLLIQFNKPHSEVFVNYFFNHMNQKNTPLFDTQEFEQCQISLRGECEKIMTELPFLLGNYLWKDSHQQHYHNTLILQRIQKSKVLNKLLLSLVYRDCVYAVPKNKSVDV